MKRFRVKISTDAGTRTRVWNILAKRSIEAARTALNMIELDGPLCIVVKPVETFIEDAPTTQEAA
jgi:hypothetical protein